MAITRNNNQILVDGQVVFYANQMGISLEKKEEYINKVLNIENNEARLKTYRETLELVSKLIDSNETKQLIKDILAI